MATQGKGLFKLVGAIFFLVGLALLGAAGWTGNRQYTVLKTWPTVEAEVVRSEVISHRDSEGITMYRAAIDFRYSVNGVEYTVPTSSSYSSSSYNSIKSDVDAYAPGTRHAIRYNPTDPHDMRYDVGYNFGFLFLPVLFGGMGIVFAGLGGLLLYLSRSVQERRCPSCSQSVGAGQSFCPNCAAPLSSS
jgi:hypothetical protein